jgi:alpha-N-arabinofuranosidase
MVNVIAPIMTSEKGLFLQPIYFPIVEFGRQRGNAALDVWVSSPTYKVTDRPHEAAYLDVSATHDAAGGRIFVNVLNRSRDKNITAAIESGADLEPSAAVWQMNHADLKAVHTFGDDQKVRPKVSTASLTIDKGAFRYEFPAHSLTILTLKKAS